MKAAWILLPALLLLSPGIAQARDIYCDVKDGNLPDGAERTADWYVVNSTVRKPHLPGQTKASPICGITFHSGGGMYRPIELLSKPKLGEAKTTYNRLTYESARNGDDLVSVRFYQAGRTGGLESATVHFRIHVVDKPL
jgi:hypothetical protein